MYNISIGKRTFIVVFCTTMILFSILFLVSNFTYSGGYAELEKENVAENLNRVSGALSAKLDTLSTLCCDWATWDETSYPSKIAFRVS